MGISKLTTSEFISRAKKIHGVVYDYCKVDYTNCASEVCIICKKHGEFWQLPYSHTKGQGCPKCRYSKPNCNRLKTTDRFIEQAVKIHNGIYDYSESNYCGSDKKLTIICKKHGKFLQTPIGHLHNKHGCPKCNSSQGEILISNWLRENDVLYENQKIFSECRNPDTNYPLRFDFYIPSKNILIEYDGEQHFKETYLSKYGNMLSDFKNTEKRDSIKNNYAKNKGIKLIRIPYYDIPNVKNILEKEFYGH